MKPTCAKNPAPQLFVLALCACALAALPANARADCWEGEKPCVRLKAGKVVNSGKCEVFKCESVGSGTGYGARFFNGKTGEESEGWGRDIEGMYSWYNCPAPENRDEGQDEAECAHDGDFLDGRPAKVQEKPVKGTGWICFEKTGTTEVMCFQDDVDPDSGGISDEEFVRLCANGAAEQIRQALANGANPDASVEDEAVAYRVSALLTAIRGGNLPAVRALLEAGADVGNRREGGIVWWTPLMEAATRGSEAMVRALLAAGADPNTGTDDGNTTALLRATHENADVGVVRALLEAGADPNAAEVWDTSPLLYAVVNGSTTVVRALLEAGADPHFTDNEDHDALWHAKNPDEKVARKDAAEIVRLLEAAVSLPDKTSLEGDLLKALPFRDRTGNNTLFLTARETRSGNTRGREIFAYRRQTDTGGAMRQIWRVYDFAKGCKGDAATGFFLNRVAVTDLDKDGVSEIWLPYGLGCLGDTGPHPMKIIMYEGVQKHAMRGTSRNPGVAPGDGGAMDAAFRSGPAVFRDYAQKLWKQIDEDYTPDR